MNDSEKFLPFLIKDFEQCFNQMRHYEILELSLFKFLVGLYSAVAVACFTLLKAFFNYNETLHSFIAAFLILIAVVGIVILTFQVRNRIYYVGVTRYINENRAFFLSSQSLGFKNEVGMITDKTKPKFFNVFSTQSVFMYLTAAFNSIVLMAGFHFAYSGDRIYKIHWFEFLCFIILTIIQIVMCIIILKRKESLKIDKAIFGKR